MSNDWNTPGWPAADDEDAIRRRQIEEMMRTDRPRYFRDELVQQEYRDIVDRQIARSENEANPKPARPGPFDEALARFKASRALAPDVSEETKPDGTRRAGSEPQEFLAATDRRPAADSIETNSIVATDTIAGDLLSWIRRKFGSSDTGIYKPDRSAEFPNDGEIALSTKNEQSYGDPSAAFFSEGKPPYGRSRLRKCGEILRS